MFLGFGYAPKASRGTFLGFSRVRTALLARFRLSRACALLSRRVFGVLACAHGSLGAFLGFSRVRIALLARFRALRVCALLSWHVFGLSSQRDALLTEFSCGKLAQFWQKPQKFAACYRASKVRVHYGDWSKNYKKIRRGLKTASKIPPLFLTREFLFRKNSRLFTAIFHFVAKSLF